MTLYFDVRVQNPETASINTLASWHPNYPLLAVAAYSQEKGGFVTVYDDQGEALPDVETSGHSVAQVTALGWHPEKRWLIAGWESGELRIWRGDSGDFTEAVTPHKDPISILQWSQHGGKLVSADTAGSVVGWRMDNRGQLFITFHHELKQAILHIAFKVTPPKTVDLSDLAKAAVAGDERALDMFSTWRPRTALQPGSNAQKDNHAFYLGSSSGSVYYVDGQGQCVEVFNTGGATVNALLHHPTRDSLVVMTEGLNITHFQADNVTGQLTEITRVKLSGKSELLRGGPPVCWIGSNTLAALTGELAVRCWDLYLGDTYVLSPPESATGNMATPQEMCTSLSFCKANETLATGTNLGSIYLWKKRSTSHVDEYGWPLTPKISSVHGTVKQLIWGGALLRSPLLAVNCITNVFILHQQTMCAAFSEDVAVSQISPTQLLMESSSLTHTLKTDIQIQIVGVSKDFVAVSSSRQVAVYRINRVGGLSTTVENTFACETEKILIYESTLIILTPVVIQLRSVDGTIIQTLPTLAEEGEPITMDLTGQFLTVASLNGILKIWDISKREAKLHTRAMTVYEAINDFAEIIEARCNSDCRSVSITVAMSNLLPSSVLYIWDIEGDQIFEFDFANLNESESVSKSRGRLVTAHCWDTHDPRVLVCRAQKMEGRDTKEAGKPAISGEEEEARVVLVSLFATPDHGIAVQDVRAIEDTNCRLLGVQSPHIVVLSPETEKDGSKIVRLLMREFEELGLCDEPTKKAIMDFSFYISMANMDEAFKSIKSIKNEAVWRSLAKMCVKTKQLDMAVLCLGHMKHVRGARALRQAIADSSLNLEARVGILAVELGLFADAKSLFCDAKRLDLLACMFEGSNKFIEAIALSKNDNKIREKLSYYNYARALELEGNIEKATDMYTKADCHFEVPRMLLNRPRELQAYLSTSDDPQVKNWHAQYVESTGDMEAALRLYEAAKDTLAVARLLCFLGREEEVSELVAKTNHAASAYHLAAHYESMNMFSKAVHFYTVAKAYNNAIRLCKEHSMTDELWPLATLATRSTQIDVAKYFEENDQSDKAILLYHKAGLLPKALDLAFATQQYNALQLITMDINADSDPALIQKCADFFVHNHQMDKAVELLATGKKYAQVLNLIEQHNITLSEELAEKMTIVKVENDMERENLRISTLERIGEIAFEQGNYHLATKKFTQAGNKLRAMKALLKSGDTEKICFFAQVSRQRDIYIMAGNYLQSLDWQNNSDILKNIINFYSKGKAMDLLANFYVACAQVEIDEFQNYEKALDALNQAARCLTKVTSPRDPEIQKRAVEVVNRRMTVIKRYLDIKKSFERGETEAAMFQVRQLLDSLGDNLEQSVRRGDLFATITQHYANIGDMEKARASIDELKRLVHSTVNI